MTNIIDPPQEYEELILKYMVKSEVTNKIQDMINRNQTRLILNLDSIRQFNPELSNMLLKDPIKLIPIFESHLQAQTNEILSASQKTNQQKSEKSLINKITLYRVTFEGTFGRNMVSPRGLNAELTNQLVCIQGIITRMSIVRPKLVKSVQYSEETKLGTIREYFDQYSLNGVPKNVSGEASYNSNTVSTKDIHGNPLTFEYGLSQFKDHQTVLIQEPPERTPVGQLPRSIEVLLEEDLVDKAKPGDRY